jgi:hypothetical protein
VAAAAVGFGACNEPCADPFTDCSALCLDCACCPNGISTPLEIARAVAAHDPSAPAFQQASASHFSVPQAEILHVPKRLLA